MNDAVWIAQVTPLDVTEWEREQPRGPWRQDLS